MGALSYQYSLCMSALCLLFPLNPPLLRPPLLSPLMSCLIRVVR